jgi:hypothetical protein
MKIKSKSNQIKSNAPNIHKMLTYGRWVYSTIILPSLEKGATILNSTFINVSPHPSPFYPFYVKTHMGC